MNDLCTKHPYMITFTGLKVYPDALQPDQISVIDIANGLGREGRFGNQSDHFYSVAQHSVLLAENLPKHLRLWAMLHDASEALIHDMPKPIKRAIPGYAAMEARLSKCIFAAFGLEGEVPKEVKEADNRIVLDEAMSVFETHPSWVSEHKASSLGITVLPWTRTVSRFIWLRYMYKLLGEKVSDTEVARRLRIQEPVGKTYRNPLWVA